MKVSSIRTEKIKPYKKDIFAVLDKYLLALPPRSILAVTSKIVSICEENVIKVGTVTKEDMARNEADLFLQTGQKNYDYILTIKNGILLPNAGIDESNGDGHFILWPKDPQKSANDIYDYLARRFNHRDVGVIITDSKTTPLRWGTTGVAIAHSGFLALKDYIGQPDIFGAKLRVTKANLMDALAVSAVFAMGEGDEQTPLALIEDVPSIKFQNHHPSKGEIQDLEIEIEDDLYRELLMSVKWKKKGG